MLLTHVVGSGQANAMFASDRSPHRARETVNGIGKKANAAHLFVVGYGLDYAEKYRNLPDICVLQDGVE